MASIVVSEIESHKFELTPHPPPPATMIAEFKRYCQLQQCITAVCSYCYKIVIETNDVPKKHIYLPMFTRHIWFWLL